MDKTTTKKKTKETKSKTPEKKPEETPPPTNVENPENNEENPEAHKAPNGLLPLFLTSMTQNLFKIQADVDVTEENPVKLIPKVDIQSDIIARASISDFSVIKQAILECPLEEILVVYDPNYYYGQNYFVCVTEEAVDLILHPPQPEEDEEEKKKKERPPEWISLGSENEIDIEKVVLNRDYIHVEISKKLLEFSKPCRFGDRDANDTYFEYKSFKDPSIEEIECLQINKGIQAIPELVNNATQVDWYRPINSAVQYESRSYNDEEKETIKKSDELATFVKKNIYNFEKAMQENALLNIFIDEFKDLGDEEMNIEHNMHINLQEYQSFTDLQHSKDRPVICIDWHPVQMGILGVSCVKNMTFDERAATGLNVKLKDSLILIWSLFDPIHPLLLLEAPDDIMSFQFNPLNTNIIAGGCINGQVVLWDISEYQEKLKMSPKNKFNVANTLKSTKEKTTETPIIKYMAVSSIEHSHKMTITTLQWLPKHMEISNNGELLDEPCEEVNQLITGSLDGQIYFWDLHFKKELKMLDLTWRPSLKVAISALDNTYDYGIMCLNIQKSLIYEADKKKEKGNKSLKFSDNMDKDDGSDCEIDKKQLCKFFCGTEDGDLIYANWLSSETVEEKGSSSVVENVFEGHYGPICDIKRSPFFPTIILSVGGKSFRIWKEGVTDGPLLTSPLSTVNLTSGEWSPTRPGVFFIGKRDGTIEIWDLIDRSNAATSCQNISSTGVTYLTIHQYKNKNRTNRQFLASGDDEGTLHVIEIPKNLTKIKRNEKSLMKNFFEREESRLKYITERKAVRAKEKDEYDIEHTEVKTEPTATGEAAAQAQGQPQETQEGGEGEEENEEEKEALKMEEEFKEIEKNINKDSEKLILSDDEDGPKPPKKEEEEDLIA